MSRAWAFVVALLPLFLPLLLSACGKRATPPLTEARVIEELGRDELVFALFVVRDECVSEALARCRPDKVPGRDEELAALAVGWVESICENEPSSNKLTAAGRLASAHGITDRDKERPCNSLQRSDFVIARYDRTGPPIIRPGETPLEKIVTIPGRWIPNDDGKVLAKAGYPPVVVVDRREAYTFYDGIWARRHGGQ